MGKELPQIGSKRIFKGKEYVLYARRLDNTFLYGAAGDKEELTKKGFDVKIVERKKGLGLYLVYRRKKMQRKGRSG